MIKRAIEIAPEGSLKSRLQQSESPIENGLAQPSEIIDKGTVLGQQVWETWQVISPGRSGTRWLADVLIACSHYGVVHASRPTLAKVGFLLDQGMISPEEAWGAYLHSRAEIFEDCAETHRPLVDLDCKNAPMAHIILERNVNARCVVMLREPQKFILSGLTRGYFRTRKPYEWGHLAPIGYLSSFRLNHEISLVEQAELVAYFWNRIARLAQQTLRDYPDRAFILPVEAMFASKNVTYEKLTGAGMEVVRPLLDAYPYFNKPRNSSSQSIVEAQTLDLDWSRLLNISLDGLEDSFLKKVSP